MKTKQRGYFALTTPNGTQLLHFSANCWYNLLEDTGMQAGEFSAKLGEEFSKDKADELVTLNLLTDIAFAAAKAHDQENNIDIIYNRFNVRNWMSHLKAEEGKAFWEAMTHSSVAPSGEDDGEVKK